MPLDRQRLFRRAWMVAAAMCATAFVVGALLVVAPWDRGTLVIDQPVSWERTVPVPIDKSGVVTARLSWSGPGHGVLRIDHPGSGGGGTIMTDGASPLYVRMRIIGPPCKIRLECSSPGGRLEVWVRE